MMGEMMVLKQQVILAVLAAVVCLMLSGSDGVWAQTNSDEASEIEGLSKALEGAKNPEEKRRLLADLGKINDRHALDLAVAAAADEEVAESARAAVGQIARALMASEQPPYIRRLAFLRWARCLPDSQAAKMAVDALRGDDVVLGAAAMAVVYERAEGGVLEAVTREISSLPLPVQQELMQVLVSRSSDSATAALLEMSRNKDRQIAIAAIEALGAQGGEKALARLREVLEADDAEMQAAALRGIAELGGVGEPDEATQVALLEALELVTGKAGQESGGEKAIVVAVQIAQMLAGTHPEEAGRALEKLGSRELSEPMQELVGGARLLFTIDQLPNLAKGATASSPDDQESEGGSKGDGAAIDGDPSTYWDETDGHSLYKLRVDLPETTDVSAISVSGWGHHSFSPKDFRIVCDDKTVKTVTGATYADNRLIVVFPRTRCTSVELQITGYYGGSPAVRELGIFDVPQE
jgi:HEAT repeat protein